jgi:hypothetical protein
MNPSTIKALAQFMLVNAHKFEWEAQGFGFLRLRISNSVRLHVWDSRLRTPGVSDIHDHKQWNFTSHVVSGSIINVLYRRSQALDEDSQEYTEHVIDCGIGGGLTETIPQKVYLFQEDPVLLLPGDYYSQDAEEIHRTAFEDGTVTLLEQRRTDSKQASVFTPINLPWVNAMPRKITWEEAHPVLLFALAKLLAIKG